MTYEQYVVNKLVNEMSDRIKESGGFVNDPDGNRIVGARYLSNRRIVSLQYDKDGCSIYRIFNDRLFLNAYNYIIGT